MAGRVISHPNDAEGYADTGLGWSHIGWAPILGLIMTFLAAFAVIGFAIQAASRPDEPRRGLPSARPRPPRVDHARPARTGGGRAAPGGLRAGWV